MISADGVTGCDCAKYFPQSVVFYLFLLRLNAVFLNLVTIYECALSSPKTPYQVQFHESAVRIFVTGKKILVENAYLVESSKVENTELYGANCVCAKECDKGKNL